MALTGEGLGAGYKATAERMLRISAAQATAAFAPVNSETGPEGDLRSHSFGRSRRRTDRGAVGEVHIVRAGSAAEGIRRKVSGGEAGLDRTEAEDMRRRVSAAGEDSEVGTPAGAGIRVDTADAADDIDGKTSKHQG